MTLPDAARAEYLYSTEEGPRRRRLHYLLPSGEYRAVLVDAAHDNADARKRIGDALGADRVVSKGEAKRLGWRPRGRQNDSGAT